MLDRQELGESAGLQAGKKGERSGTLKTSHIEPTFRVDIEDRAEQTRIIMTEFTVPSIFSS